MYRILLVVAFFLIGIAAQGAEPKFVQETASKTHLFDAMKHPASRKPIVALIIRHRLPHWAKGIPKNRNYTSSPALKLISPFPGAMVYNACQVHNCGHSRIQILVTPSKKHAFALLKEGKSLRFVGHPNKDEKLILKAAMAR